MACLHSRLSARSPTGAYSLSSFLSAVPDLESSPGFRTPLLLSLTPAARAMGPPQPGNNGMFDAQEGALGPRGMIDK